MPRDVENTPLLRVFKSNLDIFLKRYALVHPQAVGLDARIRHLWSVIFKEISADEHNDPFWPKFFLTRISDLKGNISYFYKKRRIEIIIIIFGGL